MEHAFPFLAIDKGRVVGERNFEYHHRAHSGKMKVELGRTVGKMGFFGYYREFLDHAGCQVEGAEKTSFANVASAWFH